MGRERGWAAAICTAVAAFLAYLVWSRQPGLRVPPAVGYLAAVVFLAAAVVLLHGAESRSPLRLAGIAIILLGFAGIGGWIAVGPGARECAGSLNGLPFVPGELACRGGFGAGALINLSLLWFLVKSWR